MRKLCARYGLCMLWRGHDLSQATDRSGSASTYSASCKCLGSAKPTLDIVCMNMPGSKVDVASKPHYLSGYPSLANFVASDRDRTTLIYKRFNELAAKSSLPPE
jgi:hypothetical protein